jgi:hypothetical protein
MDIYMLYIQILKTQGLVGDDDDRGIDVFRLDSSINTQIY